MATVRVFLLSRVSVNRLLLLQSLVLLLVACSDPGDITPRKENIPDRVVVIAPALAEMLAALDLLDRVVGIGQFGPWPESIAGKTEAGGYDNPNIETLLELETDLLLNTKSQAASDVHRQLDVLGIEVMALDTSTYEGVFDALLAIGKKFNRVQQARKLVRDMREGIAAVEKRSEGLPLRKVLVVVGREPLYVAGPGSHIDRLIRLAGGSNIAQDALSAYQQMSLEAILERQPEVIIDTSLNQPTAPRGNQPGDWKQWPFLPAVKRQQVHWVDPSQLVIPGMRLPEMTRLMGRFIHPEEFGEPDRRDYLKPGVTTDDSPH